MLTNCWLDEVRTCSSKGRFVGSENCVLFDEMTMITLVSFNNFQQVVASTMNDRVDKLNNATKLTLFGRIVYNEPSSSFGKIEITKIMSTGFKSYKERKKEFWRNSSSMSTNCWLDEGRRVIWNRKMDRPFPASDILCYYQYFSLQDSELISHINRGWKYFRVTRIAIKQPLVR